MIALINQICDSFEQGFASFGPSRKEFGAVSVKNCWSCRELQAELDELEAAEDGMRQTVVLVLPEGFRAPLRDIIGRKRPGFRLVLTSVAGGQPGMTDMSLTSSSLGWLLITFRRDMNEAIDEAIESLQADERCVVLVVGPEGR